MSMDEIKARVKDVELLNRLFDPEDIVKRFIPKRGSIAFGGMASTAYPKVIPKAIAKYIEATGERFELIVYSGGFTGVDFEENLAKIKIKRRYPLGGSADVIKRLANDKIFEVSDIWLYEYSTWLRYGIFNRKFGKIDVAVIEATEIREDGIVLSNSVDAVPALVDSAERIIIELSLIKPSMYGMHDIASRKTGEIINIKNVIDRVGDAVLKVPKSKIAAIVPSNLDDQRGQYTPGSDIDRKVVENIINFLNEEVKKDPNLKSEYTTLQPAAGPIASLLADRIVELGIKLRIWGEVATVRWIRPLEDGILDGISASVLYALPGDENLKNYFYENIARLKDKIVLRPYEIANNPQVISRFIHIVVQQALEVDLYGNVNISHIGDNLYAAVGGSGDHIRPSYLTIIALPSITGKGIPRIVPIAYHIDVTSHDVDVIVTEQGWADLRGLSPRERAKLIIERCAHPRYKDLLWRYYEKVIEGKRGHQPRDFIEAQKFREEVMGL